MLKILDCTLRDGGYYNNWHFNDKLVQNYLRAMEACSVNTVEIGFRFIDAKENIGPYGVSDEEFLASLNLPSSLNYAVMINGKEYLSIDEEKLKDQVGKNFLPSRESCISMVRIAINFNDALDSRPILKELKDLGYEIGLNLMQSNGKKETEYEKIAKEIQSWDLVDVLYFADSFGNMDPKEVNLIIKSLKRGWQGKLGFHSHDNKGFALINSLQAIDSDIAFCDATVKGMGRGAGNVSTESLLMELQNRGTIEDDLSLIQGTVSDFTLLKDKYGWGTNMHYQYAANNNIHPTFVQTLSEDNRYDQYQSFKILEGLANEVSSSSFSDTSLKNIVYKDSNDKEGSWNPDGFLAHKEVLLVGGGYSAGENKDKILDFINKNAIEVIFTNINKYLPQEIGKATIVSHEIRAFLDASSYSQLSHPIIMPVKSLGKVINKHIQDIEVLDYGLNLKEGEMNIGPKSCQLHNSVVAGYALSILTQAKASKIYLVGFDGYQVEDVRYQEMAELLQRYTQLEESVELVSLTPTLYPLKVISLDD